ncbi:MAG: MCE family protein [Mycobacteriales bacterium]
MKPFRERNPVPIGLIGVLVLVGLVLLAFNAPNLPIIGGGTTYYADFTNASNLATGNDVRLAGVKVGQVDSIDLHGTVVQVGFRVKGVTLGRDSTAAIKIKTLLGEMYVALTSSGPGSLPGGAVIPLSRTSTPFNVPTAFIGLAQHIQAINTGQLAKAFDTLATTFQNTPPEVKSSLVGLERLSATIATRDAAVTALLQHANVVTGELAARDAQVRRLINDGALILQTVDQQAAVIHALLINTSTLATQLTALVQENRAVITPALDNLHSVITILQKDQAQLVNSFHLIAPFVRDFTNTLGNGEWFDTYVANLFDTSTFEVVPNNQGTVP